MKKSKILLALAVTYFAACIALSFALYIYAWQHARWNGIFCLFSGGMMLSGVFGMIFWTYAALSKKRTLSLYFCRCINPWIYFAIFEGFSIPFFYTAKHLAPLVPMLQTAFYVQMAMTALFVIIILAKRKKQDPQEGGKLVSEMIGDGEA